MGARKYMAVGAAGAMVVAGAGIGIGAAAATASPSTHYWRFVVHTLQDKDSGYTFQSAEVEKTRGRVVGFDSVSGVYHPRTNKVVLWVSLTRAGGSVQAYLTSTGDSPVDRGYVTGGTGRYRNAHGTVYARSISESATKVLVKIRY